MLAVQPRSRALVSQFCRADAGGFGLDNAALVGQCLRGGERQRAAGQQVAGGVDGLRVHHHIAGGIAAVVRRDTGFDDAGVAHAGRVEFDALAGSHTLLVDQRLCAGHLNVAGGIDLVGQVNALRRDIDVTRGRRLRHAQMPIGIKLNIPTTGRQRPVELHAHAGFGAYQFDRAGVHAAQRAGVDGQLGFGAAVVGACGGFQALGIDVVAPGGLRPVRVR